MLVRNASGPSDSDRNKVAELRRIRDVDPSNRKAHSNLVRRAIRDGHPDALAFAKDWALSDPDHAPALQAHADLLAAAGDPVALRAYASAIEVEPFSTKMHERMAEAHTLAGDFERACSHRRALVSIDPTNGDDAAQYAECLASSGRVAEARAALAKARETVTSSAGSKALSKAEKAVEQGVAVPSSALHGNADLRAELRWTTDENLDLAFVDRRGQRLSVLRPEGVRVREERDGAQHVEVMTLREVKGTVFVEVTRPESNNEEPVRATLTVKVVGGTQSWTLLLERAGTQRIALARW
jgi:tetratricopeptide (TPR) repeat protein